MQSEFPQLKTWYGNHISQLSDVIIGHRVLSRTRASCFQHPLDSPRSVESWQINARRQRLNMDL